MELLTNLLPIIGVVLCVMVACQLMFWSAQTMGFLKLDRQQFQKRQSEFRQQLQQTLNQRTLETRVNTGHWQGFRSFRVDRLEKESANITSVYLIPSDGKPIAEFKSGQHLTFRFQIPQLAKTVVRCYSLSNGPAKPYYRISVKEVLPPADRPELGIGKASHFVNRQLAVGQQLEVKAPTGDFFLDEQSDRPLVLLAGGIGITPMISMIERLIETNSDRLTLLAYGVNHSDDHAFKDYLNAATSQHPNIHLLTCYSKPHPYDRLGVDFQFAGRVSVELLQSILPGPDCDFYLCGPPPFMNSIHSDLLAWNVDENKIHFEAFGPASISSHKPESNTSAITVEPVAVKFTESDLNANWDGTHNSLLEFAEAHGVVVDSGCRAGSCGSCQTEIISGSVEYPDGQKTDCPKNHGLLCIARPRAPLELRA